MTDLHVTRWGEAGERVVLVHGDVRGGAATFAAQQPLAERWRLVVPDRQGFESSPRVRRQDFELDAVDVADLIEDGAHLVGHSHGGVVAMFAAALRPEAVRSLAVSEPPAFGLARGNPDADAMVERLDELLRDPPASAPEALRAFLAAVGSDASWVPDPLPPVLEQHVAMLMDARPPWEAEVPLERLRAAGIPALVISGGHSAAFDAVCDVIEGALGARRVVIEGAGHSLPLSGEPYNRALEELWTAGRP
jgi:pimeloyl-ACP methyl ester carboxylesterase